MMRPFTSLTQSPSVFVLLLKWQKATGGRRSGAGRERRVVAESDADPGAAAEEEEAEAATHAGAGSVLAAGKVKTLI